jgi:hypothetical protein
MNQAKEILPRLLQLSTAERGHLVLELIRSLDGSNDPHAAEAWLTELEQRAVDAGKTSGMENWNSVRHKIEARLQRA